MKKYGIAVLAVLLIAAVFCGKFLEKRAEIAALRELPYYTIYQSYVARDEQYRVFLMLNDRTANPEDILSHFSDTFVRETVSAIHTRSYGEHPIVVHILLPGDELPYGWSQSEENIAANIDTSVFYRNTHWLLTIPYSAESLAECTLEVRETSYT
ncbi:MAG: hypothetical protein E7658_01160 [Ruminococcaceae bacterium]|nr:hypothetical protein [Oscillospiraceae bacterium]